MQKQKSISIVGPSARFLSGISYYTTYLSNSLTDHYNVNAVLFKDMLPKILFPGAKRVGSNLSNVSYKNYVNVNECIDWYNPVSWIKAYIIISKSGVCVFEWWTSSVAHMYVFLGILLKLKGIPIILEFHEVVDTLEDSIMPIRLYSKMVGKLIRKLSSKYVVHSESDKKLVADRYNIENESIDIIKMGLYDQYQKHPVATAREYLNISLSEYVILFFGLIRPYKGVSYLIDAFEKLPEDILNKSTLIIAGEIWEDSDVLNKINKSHAKNNIRLYDEYIDDNFVSYLFSSANVLVLPYLRASQSAVAHIGMSYGIPIISSKVGGLIDSIGKYDGTFFVAAKDTTQLSLELAKNYGNDNNYNIPESLRWSSVAFEWVTVVDKLM